MKVIKYTILRNGEVECFFWAPVYQFERINLVLTKLMRISAHFIPTSNYQFEWVKTEI